MTARTASVLAITLLATACGVRTESRYTAIGKADIPVQLNESTTTSTTTTTLPPTTTTTLPATTAPAPTTTLPPTTTTTLPPTTTTTVPSEQVLLYLVVGAGQLEAIPVTLPKEVTPDQAITELLRPPPRKAPLSARSVLTTTLLGPPPYVTVAAGIATVALDKSFFQPDTLSVDQQVLAFGQIVLTLTLGKGFGIGKVQFTVAGKTRSAVRSDRFQPTEASADDYADLVVKTP